jgi:hypothetical protein
MDYIKNTEMKCYLKDIKNNVNVLQHWLIQNPCEKTHTYFEELADILQIVIRSKEAPCHQR